jgi:beta-glucosidase
VGVQYYQRQLVKPWPVPLLRGVPWISKDHRRYEITAMGWEVQPDGLYESLARWHGYGVGKLIVTENGAAFPDRLVDGAVHDDRRTAFYRAHLAEVRRAIADGMDVGGYFCWSLMDNFEWAEGYDPRFGLVHVDFATQQRTIKDSGRWFQQFLAG